MDFIPSTRYKKLHKCERGDERSVAGAVTLHIISVILPNDTYM